jgi:Ca2+-binding EF-hand superfamily protein
LREFKGQSKLKKAAMNMMVKMADQNAIEDLKEQFHKMDKDGTGMINADELKQAMIESSVEMPEEEIERIIESVDYVGNQMINYTEFLVATMDVK